MPGKSGLKGEISTVKIFKEGFSQEQCGDFMQVARTTVQQIYASARKSSGFLSYKTEKTGAF